MRSEQELLLNLQRGDPSAWEEYVHIYGKQLYNYLYHQLPTVEDIEDVMSETDVMEQNKKMKNLNIITTKRVFNYFNP